MCCDSEQPVDGIVSKQMLNLAKHRGMGRQGLKRPALIRLVFGIVKKHRHAGCLRFLYWGLIVRCRSFRICLGMAGGPTTYNFPPATMLLVVEYIICARAVISDRRQGWVKAHLYSFLCHCLSVLIEDIPHKGDDNVSEQNLIDPDNSTSGTSPSPGLASTSFSPMTIAIRGLT